MITTGDSEPDARAGIPRSWVVNLKESIVEAYSEPSGEATVPAYGTKAVYRKGDVIALELKGSGVVEVGEMLG